MTIAIAESKRVRTDHVAHAHTAKRGDVQGLRALAVTMVVIYHYFPAAAPGGFVGVDVFFVISGYLITGLLIREIDVSGSICLPSFYARRIRRLMPAAGATTAVVVIAAALILSPVAVQSVLRDATWTSGYLANVRFAHAPGGYFAAVTPSPLLHFWSLAVEEQYYLTWPVLLLLVTRLAKRRAKALVPALLIAVLTASLIASVVLTRSGSNDAYYSLATRGWELAIGGIVAFGVFSHRRAPSTRAAAAVGAAGLGCALFAAFSYSSTTSFPGVAALLPTIGTACVIWSGSSCVGPVASVLSRRPLQVVGDMSYSLYLWHWPVLVLGGDVVGRGRLSRMVLLVLTVLFASGSYVLVEQRGRRVGQLWRSRTVLAVGAAFAVLGGGLAYVLSTNVRTTSDTIAAPLTANRPTAVVEDGTISISGFTSVVVPAQVPRNATPSLVGLVDDLADVFTNGCYGAGVNVCEGGDPNGTAKIVLAGDSHVGQWWPAVNEAAIRHRWKLYIVGKNGCALADVEITMGSTADGWPDCSDWQRRATATIFGLHADLIIYGNNAQGYEEKVSLRGNFSTAWSAGVSATLKDLTADSAVLYLGQSPILKADPAACLSENIRRVENCSTPLNQAVDSTLRDLDPSLARQSGALFFDLSSMLCTQSCPMMDHNIVMYRDVGHVSRTYSLASSDKFAAVIGAALTWRQTQRP